MLRSLGAAAMSVVILLCSTAADAQLTVLRESGAFSTTGDGISAFRDIVTDTRRYAMYKGVQSAIFDVNAAVLTVRMSTGDPLPAPLNGTFNSFEHAVVGDAGDMVFLATTNSTDIDAGYFIDLAAGGIVHLDGGLATRANLPADINSSADVVWLNKDRELYLFEDPTGAATNTLIAERGGTNVPGGGEWRAFGDRPVISNNGMIAFIADLGSEHGIFHYDPALATFAEVARQDGAAPIAGYTYDRQDLRSMIAIDDAGRVAFVADLSGGPLARAAFLFDPATGTTSVVAQEGDALAGGGNLEELDDDFIAIDDAGRVAFHADIDPAVFQDHRVLMHDPAMMGGGLLVRSPMLLLPAFSSPRLTYAAAPVAGTPVFEINVFPSPIQILTAGAGVNTVLDRTTVTPLGTDVAAVQPSISHNGQVVFALTHQELHVDSFAAAGPVPIQQVGSTVPGGLGYTVTSLGPIVANRKHAAFMVGDDGPPPPCPLGCASHTIGHVRLNNPAAVVRVAGTNDPAHPSLGGTVDLGAPSPLAIRGGKVTYISSITGGNAAEAVLRGRFGQLSRPLVVTGAPTPVGPLIQIYKSNLSSVGKRIAFEAQYGAGDIGLLTMRARNAATLSEVVRAGDPFPGGVGLVDEPIGSFAINKRGEVAFAIQSDADEIGLFVWTAATGATPIARSEDAIPSLVGAPPGATFSFDETTRIAFNKRGDVFFVSEIIGGDPYINGLFLYEATTGSLTALVLAPGTVGGGTLVVDSVFEDRPLTLSQQDLFSGFALSLAGAARVLASVPY